MSDGWPTERKNLEARSEVSCLSCGSASGTLSFPADDDIMSLEPGQFLICSKCGTAMEIVADGLRLLSDEDNTPAEREERLRYWATQRG